jgi:acyl carrier protein
MNFQVQPENIEITQDELFSAQSMTIEEIQDWLAYKIAEQLGTDPDGIDIQTPFSSYGLASVQAMSIATEGKRQFGVSFSPLVMWNFPNIESLSKFLVKELAESEVEVFEI